jgi:hypothetical protein
MFFKKPTFFFSHPFPMVPLGVQRPHPMLIEIVVATSPNFLFFVFFFYKEDNFINQAAEP